MLVTRAVLLALVLPAAALRVGTAARSTAARASTRMSHCNIYPIFTLKDYEKAKPLMDECVEATKAESGCFYYGWTVNEDKTKLFCRETYVDGSSAGRHLAAAGPTVTKMIESGAVELDSIGVMGGPADLFTVKAEADKLGCAYWKVWDSFDNFAKVGAEMDAASSFCTVQPTFTINDLAKAEPFMQKCVDATKTEEGCMYYGWAISEDGSKLFCREAYVDGAAVNAHILNVVSTVGEMLDSGAVSLDSIELHGPKAEWAACKEEADKLGMVYFDVDSSFGKFVM